MNSATSAAPIATAATHKTSQEAGKQQEACAGISAPVSRRYSPQTNQQKKQKKECHKHYRLKAGVWDAIRY